MIGIPPGETIEPVIDAILEAVENKSDRPIFKILTPVNDMIQHYNGQIISDLNSLLKQCENLTSTLLIPRHYANFKQDQVRSDFFSRLSLILGEYRINEDPQASLPT